MTVELCHQRHHPGWSSRSRARARSILQGGSGGGRSIVNTYGGRTMNNAIFTILISSYVHENRAQKYVPTIQYERMHFCSNKLLSISRAGSGTPFEAVNLMVRPATDVTSEATSGLSACSVILSACQSLGGCYHPFCQSPSAIHLEPALETVRVKGLRLFWHVNSYTFQDSL